MFNLFKKKESFQAPVSGKLIPLSEVNDAVFSAGMMGQGFAFVPSDSTICAPMSGEISVCFPTKHAIGIKTDNGVEILIHIGIDTVELKGEGFNTHVTQGQKIKQGDKLVDIDMEVIRSHGYDPTVIVVFPSNTVDLSESSKDVKLHDVIAVKLS